MEALFHTLGFSEIETRAYLALTESGRAPATGLAKRLTIPRSTAYSVLEGLVSRGVIVVDREKEPAQYTPLDPGSFLRTIELQKQESDRQFDQQSNAARELEKLVRPLFLGQEFNVPRIQFFDGTRNVESMLYTYDKVWQESISHFDHTWWGYQDVQFIQSYRGWLEKYWKGLKEKEKIRLLSNRTEVEKKLKGKVERREIKALPKGVEFSSTIWILGEYVVCIMARQQPHYAFQIKDPILAANQRTIFQMLWKSIK